MLKENMKEIVPEYLKLMEIVWYLRMDVARVKTIDPDAKYYPIDKLATLLEDKK